MCIIVTMWMIKQGPAGKMKKKKQNQTKTSGRNGVQLSWFLMFICSLKSTDM